MFCGKRRRRKGWREEGRGRKKEGTQRFGCQRIENKGGIYSVESLNRSFGGNHLDKCACFLF